MWGFYLENFNNSSMCYNITMQKYSQFKPENKIVTEDHPALHIASVPIPEDEIKSKYVQDLINHMSKMLAEQIDGVGLAAPQVGVPLQLFIVSGKVFLNDDEREIVMEADKKKKKHKIIIPKDLVCINPKIIKTSKDKKWMDGEGCLSVRWFYGKVHRALRVTIKAYDRDGNSFTRGASGLLSHIFQHEVDHLNGILFIDKAKEIRQFDPEEIVA
jgi:peptide deformylase